MKKIFAIVALGMMLMSSAFAIPNFMKHFYPVFTGSLNNPNVKVVDDQDDVIFVEVDGQHYVIIK
jgi:hypothetical protein